MLKTPITAVERNTNHVFTDDLQTGEYGEYRTKKYLDTYYKDKIMYAEDKSDVYKYQRADVDLLIQFKGRDVQGIEVKNDTTLYPNLFFEVVSVAKKGKKKTPGCMLVTEADVLFYIYQALGVSVVVPLTKLRQWVVKYVESGQCSSIKTVYNKEYLAKGYAVPLRKLMDSKTGVEGIKLVDLETNRRLTFEQYDNRRRTMTKKTKGKFYTQTTQELGWKEENQKLWQDHNEINLPLKGDYTRLQQASDTMNKLL